MNLETCKQGITDSLLIGNKRLAKVIRGYIEHNQYKIIFGVELSALDKRDFIEACIEIELTK